jgi:hypothetical protein
VIRPRAYGRSVSRPSVQFPGVFVRGSRGVGLALVLVLLVAVSGCGGAEERPARAASPPAPECPQPWKDGWQRLADRIEAPVYCPSWMPTPLDGAIDGQWNNINSVGKDGSYLMGFTWYEVQSGEVHVNFRGRPGTTEIPICQEVETEAGKTRRRKVPCFADPQGTKRLGEREVTVYTRNRGADVWHVLYAWEENGSLYAVSQHVAEPHTFSEVVEHLDRITRGLVRIEPDSA